MLCHLTPSAFGQSAGQDIVVQKSPTGSPVRRSGTILRWEGLTLQLQQSGRIRDIDGEEVVGIETQWPTGYEKGLSEFSRNDFTAATNLFATALAQEQRPWAQNIVRSKILRCHLATENLSAAASTFFQIIATDPQSRFVPLCPLRWTGNDTGMNQLAADWIQSAEPIVQLLGASWSIGKGGDMAREVLQDLALDIDPSVAGLAVGQLWNLRQTKMTAAELKVWQDKIETMPIPVRAGPHYAIAAASARSGFDNAAITNYMRIAILYPDQPLLAAPALYQSASLLHNRKDDAAAQKLIAELKAKYPATNWAAR